ncbi:MAG: DNA-binding transcriptional regulator [Opitutales bacterium]
MPPTTPPGKKMLHIALALDTRERYFREIRAGVCEYALPRDPWVFRGVNRTRAGAETAAAWGPAGIIGGFDDEEALRAWSSLGVPIVHVAFRVPPNDQPRVGVNDPAVGEKAVDYFLAKGFHHFAFLGSSTDAYARMREAGFSSAVERHGFPCLTRFGHTHEPAEDAPLGDWLASLPPQTALLASDDRWGLRACEVARERGLDIPHDIAILGVGDGDICEMTFPRLSSIALPGRRIGFEAARMLEHMIAGNDPSSKALLLDPFDVVERAGTHVVAVRDPVVSKALQHIAHHARSNLRVSDLARHAGINRRTLEIKFKTQLGLSPLTMIRKARVDQIRGLLLETELSLDEIAEVLAFPNAQRMSTVFREVAGTSPGQFRKKHRLR